MGRSVSARTGGVIMRVGIGYDVHRFTKKRELILGGVTIPNAQGLAGHSDADVLLHSIMDALLGAAALRDIGCHFPDTDEAYENVDSRMLLRETAALLRRKGYLIVNVDSTILCQKPKLASYIPLMITHIALDLELYPGAVNVKATTTEGLGSIGREEGIAAMAIALLHKTI